VFIPDFQLVKSSGINSDIKKKTDGSRETEKNNNINCEFTSMFNHWDQTRRNGWQCYLGYLLFISFVCNQLF